MSSNKANPPTGPKSLNQHLAPYGVFGRLRESARVVKISTAFADDVWLITRFDDVSEMLVDPRLSQEARYTQEDRQRRLQSLNFRAADAFPDNMLVADPPRHTRLRRLVLREFTARRVAELTPFVQRLTDDLIDRLPTDRPVDIVTGLADPLPIGVISRLIGFPPGDVAWLAEQINRLSALSLNREIAEDIGRARRTFWDYLIRTLEEKRRHPGDDLLSALVSAHDQDDRLSDDELVSMTGLLVSAGYETTSSMIGSGLLLLLRHPRQMAELIREPERITAAVEEMLRYDGPVTLGLVRFAKQDIEIGDTIIPKGDLIMAGLATANHDGREFTDAETFRSDRQDNQHLAFGRGVHYCLGAQLARLELRIAFTALLRRHPGMRLAVPAEEIPWRSTFSRGPSELPLQLGPPGGPPDSG